MATENKNREEDASALSSHYVFCPGRVCLFGEHSDWAGGMRRFNPEIPVGKTLVCGTNVGIHARTRALFGTDDIAKIFPKPQEPAYNLSFPSFMFFLASLLDCCLPRSSVLLRSMHGRTLPAGIRKKGPRWRRTG